jgi:hypothetical protein
MAWPSGKNNAVYPDSNPAQQRASPYFSLTVRNIPTHTPSKQYNSEAQIKFAQEASPGATMSISFPNVPHSILHKPVNGSSSLLIRTGILCIHRATLHK